MNNRKLEPGGYIILLRPIIVVNCSNTGWNGWQTGVTLDISVGDDAYKKRTYDDITTVKLHLKTNKGSSNGC